MTQQNLRVAYWGDAYLESTRESYWQAQRFSREGNYFTAYLYLFVAFNNLYALLAPSERGQPNKIKKAIKRIEDKHIEEIYTHEYFRCLCELNDRVPEQFSEGPDLGAVERGVLNMRDYFLGKEPGVCMAHIGTVAAEDAEADVKKRTLQHLAADLLYTVRNNQFHAVKGQNNFADQCTLRLAYSLLEPIVEALLPLGEREIADAKQAHLITNEGRVLRRIRPKEAEGNG